MLLFAGTCNRGGVTWRSRRRRHRASERAAINTVLCVFLSIPPVVTTLLRARITGRSRTSARDHARPWTWQERSPETGPSSLLDAAVRAVAVCETNCVWRCGAWYLHTAPRFRATLCACGVSWDCAQPPRCRLRIIAETFASHVIGKFDLR